MDLLSRRTFFAAGCAAAAGVLAVRPPARAAGPAAADLDAVLTKAFAGLAELQTPDGAFAPKLGGPGVTALAAAALLRAGRPADDPVVAKALKVLGTNIRPDGGIYQQRLANYTTCVALLAFVEANTDGKYDTVIADASKFLKGLQTGDEETPDHADPTFGGVGYDGKSRPDLSNTHFFVDALLAAGTPKDDPAIKNALVFVGRCQNLKSEYNELAYAAKATPEDKGGFAYNPLDAGNDTSPNRTAAGGLRSAGTMTYAGLKSFLYAGVDRNDERVKAAVDWVRRHYSVDENPGQGTAGLYYYYHLFAKGLDAWGEDPFADADGVKHDWRADLFAALKKRQRADGTWANDNRAFQENVPELATAFAVLALSYCRPKAG